MHSCRCRCNKVLLGGKSLQNFARFRHFKTSLENLMKFNWKKFWKIRKRSRAEILLLPRPKPLPFSFSRGLSSLSSRRPIGRAGLQQPQPASSADPFPRAEPPVPSRLCRAEPRLRPGSSSPSSGRAQAPTAVGRFPSSRDLSSPNNCRIRALKPH